MTAPLPLSRAFLRIFISILLFSGIPLMGWLYYLNRRERHLGDEQYRIVALMQKVSQGEVLKTVYLAELLDLSLDQPANLYQFNLREAERKLQSNPLIKRAKVKKILPGTLYIDYEVRIPVAYLGDFTNTALDEEGVLFPFRPFFTPKCLPVLYLGREKEGQYSWGNCLKEIPSLQLAWSILRQFEQLQEKKIYIKQLDVSHAFADSEGKRQVVVVLEERPKNWESVPGRTFFLRLNADHYEQGLVNFQTLQPTLLNEFALSRQTVIDLRIPKLAFIQPDS